MVYYVRICIVYPCRIDETKPHLACMPKLNQDEAIILLAISLIIHVCVFFDSFYFRRKAVVQLIS